MSRYDYRDPGQDPEYCNGLSPLDDYDDDYWVPVEWLQCIYCGDRYLIGAHEPYCSSLCAVQAAVDDAQA